MNPANPIKFHVLTLFPQMIFDGLNHSVIKRAIDNGIIFINCVNIRDFAGNKHNKVDDYPYGGGTGLIMRPQPIYEAYRSIEGVDKNTIVCHLSPRGRPFTQQIAKHYAGQSNIVFICGHYEGIDQRVIDEIATDEISIGDYVLTGGELAAMVVIDATARLVPNVLSKKEATENESFENGLLEHSQYTRPPIFLGREVPSVLLGGNHKEIEKYRQTQAIEITAKRRPDLL
ncbi:MAG: tRNA (guanosine(37)-N1)-methyltransferase TrmD [Defluviitaleaceae bacterium]|nr:tRNA (guanosine(37)-N1)-methyltransferase TrmD [Defluviitaleaceae bacterium]